MNKGLLVCCLVCLAADAASGQPPAAYLDPEPSTPLPGAGYPLFRPDPALALPPPPESHGGGRAARRLDWGPWYVSAEADFLLRFTQGERPARVSSLNGPASLGVGIDLAGANRQGPPMPGGRVTLGAWSADDGDPMPVSNVRLARWGGEVSGYYLGERSVGFAGTAAVLGLGTSNLAGRATFDIWGMEANIGGNVFKNPPSQLIRIDLLGGFRYLNLDGDVTVGRQTTFAPDLTPFPAFALLAGNTISQVASYRARNQFYGGQVGLRTQFLVHGAAFVGDFKLALGGTHQELDVAGQVQSAVRLPVQLSGPFPADSGSFSRNKFSYIPQLDLAVVVPLRYNLTARLGYSLLYWSGVVRAADQIDTNSAFGSVEVFRDRGLFLHGVDVGLQWNF